MVLIMVCLFVLLSFISSNTVAMVLSLTAAVTKGDATDSIEEVIKKIADSKAIGLLSLKNVIIKGKFWNGRLSFVHCQCK